MSGEADGVQEPLASGRRYPVLSAAFRARFEVIELRIEASGEIAEGGKTALEIGFRQS
jgi:hypothetical protein